MTNQKTAAVLLASLLTSVAAAQVNYINADIGVNTTWLTGQTYVLDRILAVRSGATLTVQPGVIIRGQPRDTAAFNPGTLVVAKGSRIIANGTANNPIIFTTAAIDNDSDGFPDTSTSAAGTQTVPFFARASGPNPNFWDANPLTNPRDVRYVGMCGGLVVLGRAPTNRDNTGLEAQPWFLTSGNVEGVPLDTPASYGGDFRYDSSGVLNYISLRHGGGALTANNEINGLTLAGVGQGTVVENIEVWGNADDGVEWFGGTVDAKNLVVVGSEDDAFDADEGFTGKVQFGLIIAGARSDSFFELDGDEERSNNVAATQRPVTNPIFANITAIGNTGSARTAAAIPNRFPASGGGLAQTGTAGLDNVRGIFITDNCMPFIINSIVAHAPATGLQIRTERSTPAVGNVTVVVLPPGDTDPTNDRLTLGAFDSRQRFIDGDAFITHTTFADFNGGITGATLPGIYTNPNNPSDATLAGPFPPGADTLTWDGLADDFVINDIFRKTAAEKIADGVAQAPTSLDNRLAVPGFIRSFDAPGYPIFVNPVPLRAGQGGSSSAFTGTFNLDNLDGFFFTAATYRGAFPSVSSGNLWTTGWTAADRSGVLATRAQDTN